MVFNRKKALRAILDHSCPGEDCNKSCPYRMDDGHCIAVLYMEKRVNISTVKKLLDDVPLKIKYRNIWSELNG